MHCSAVDQANHTNHLKITVQTVYISNESATLVDVYFDDIKVTYTPGRVIQGNEYYPFGLQTATSWTRENNLGNNFLYNGGTELNKTTQVYDLYYRNYDPVLGRFGQVDPMAGKYGPVSPYHFAGNNPVVFNDPMGDEYDAFSVMDGSYVASGRGESVYRDMDPWGRYTTARIIAQSMEAIRIMRDAQDSEITVADGAHSFIFNSNGTVNYGYTSDAEFLSLLGRGYDEDDLRAMFSGAPITSNYQGGPELWQGLDGGFAVLKNGIAYIPGTDRRYAGVLDFTQGNGPGDGTFWSALGHVLGFMSGLGNQMNVYGPDSPESKAMNASPGIDQAIAHYYKTGNRKFVYEFSPHADGTNWDGVGDRHAQANNPITFTTGGYTTFISPLANGSLSIMVMNPMSANSLFLHVGDYMLGQGNGDSINPGRVPMMVVPFSTTYQFYLINRPGR